MMMMMMMMMVVVVVVVMVEKKARANREKGAKHTSGESLYNLTPGHPPRGRILVIAIVLKIIDHTATCVAGGYHRAHARCSPRG